MRLRPRTSLVLCLAAIGLAACGGPAAPTSSAAASPSVVGGPPGISRTAPDECGFPDGTVLQFAGRSTTRVLGVQEVPGSDDPLSFVPADIYVTREPLGQGANDGFLVCAIYTGEADGFVEVTTVPETWAPPTE